MERAHESLVAASIVSVLLVALTAVPAFAGTASAEARPGSEGSGVTGRADVDTLWIFFSNFEEETGWTVYDMSGGTAQRHSGRWPEPRTVVFSRGLCGLDFDEPYHCQDCVGWMYAAVDPESWKMVDGEDTWLVSPPIDVSGASALVGRWNMWVDCPEDANDYFDLYLSSDDDPEHVVSPESFEDEQPGHWFGGPRWMTFTDVWDWSVGDDWLSVCWRLWNEEPPAGDHGTGIFLRSVQIGILAGDLDTGWYYPPEHRLKEWFAHQLPEALVDTARIFISDSDGILSASLVASNTAGAMWQSYPLLPHPSISDEWLIPPPACEMTWGSRIRYYFEATDGIGNVSVYPPAAPDQYFEMRIMPTAGILLVDKHNEIIPDANREFRFYTEYYYAEALEILGYGYDCYDVFPEPSPARQSDGPDLPSLQYYDTVLWITGDRRRDTVTPNDQFNLMQWLDESTPDASKSLLLSGNDIGYDIGGSTFYETWLASFYVADSPGDTLPDLCDHTEDWEFMSHDDGCCVLAGGCPQPTTFDVVDAASGVFGAEVVADYHLDQGGPYPAGVAYAHPTTGYRTVNLGFGIEYMRESTGPGGHFVTGIHDRVDLLGNIFDYFGVPPDSIPTSVSGELAPSPLSSVYPNPCREAATVAYSISRGGRATVAVYNVAGHLVRTLLDERLPAGASGELTWDRRDGQGHRCGSGIYFFRIDAPGMTNVRKVVVFR